MNSKSMVKGVPFDPQVAGLVRRMDSVGDHRESLQRLQDVWDQLTLLGETSGIATDITATGQEFRALTDTLLDALARQQLGNATRRLRARAQVAIDLLVRNLFERTADVGFLAVDAAVRAHVEAHAAGNATPDARRALEARFRAYVAKYSVYEDVIVLAPDGTVLARLDGTARAACCGHPLLRSSLEGDAVYVESFGRIDLLDGRQGLVYSAPIRGSAGPVLGVLCLSFRFDDEMSRIFAQLTSDDRFGGVLALLDADGRVLTSSDPWQVPVGAPLRASGRGPLLRFGGREYLAVRTPAHPYQGYRGPGWEACALVPLDLAFGGEPHHGTPLLADMDALNRSPLFDEELRRIPEQARRIQRGLERSVWNGRVRGKALHGRGAAQGRFATALLQQVARTGGRIEQVFEHAISELQQSAIAGLVEEVHASAALAVDILDRNLYERANDCRWWSLDATLQQVAAGLRPAAEAAAVLAHINGLYTVYSQLLLLGRDGQVLATSTGPQTGDAEPGASWVGRALALPDDQAWTRSRFEPSVHYGGHPTYVYAATVHHRDAACGAVAIVFDSTPQLAAMLADALPRDATGAPIPQASALFVTRDGRVIASTDAAFQAGQQVPFRQQFATLPRGDTCRAVLEIDGMLCAVGVAMSGGYREYDSAATCNADDVAGVTLLRLCETARGAAPAAAARFEPPVPAPDEDLCEIATFRCAGQWLGLKVQDVVEAIDVPRITALPGAAPQMAGVVIRAGVALPIVRLDALRGHPCGDMPARGLVVVCQAPGGTPMGLLVDELGSVVEVAHAALQPLPAGLAVHDPLAVGVVRGAAQHPSMLTLIDPARIASRASTGHAPPAPAATPPGQARPAPVVV